MGIGLTLAPMTKGAKKAIAGLSVWGLHSVITFRLKEITYIIPGFGQN